MKQEESMLIINPYSEMAEMVLLPNFSSPIFIPRKHDKQTYMAQVRASKKRKNIARRK